MTPLSVAFWVACLAVLHVFVLYPLTLVVLSRIRPARDAAPAYDDLPHVALVVAAYNEESVIAEKVENCLALDYPDDRLDVVVFSDASSDATDDIVRSYADRGVSLVRVPGRVGKTACQNHVVDGLDADVDVVVFSDADGMYEPDAINRLVERFDEGVGCVVGELRYRSDSGVETEGVYRAYELLIKRHEPRVSSIVGGNGAIYAVRRDAYVALDPDAISDFDEPLAIVQRGLRAEYAPDARSWERTGASVTSETRRRVRIVTRSWHSLVPRLSLLNPIRHGLFSYQLFSHTLLRWLSPLLLLAVLGLNAALVATGAGPLYDALLLGQGLFYACALVAGVCDRYDVSAPVVLQVPYYFVMLNYSLLVGFARFLQQENVVVWDTEARET